MHERTVRAIERTERNPVHVYLTAPLELAQEAETLGRRLSSFDAGIRFISRLRDAGGAPAPVESRRALPRKDLLRARMLELEACDLVLAVVHEGVPSATVGDVAFALAHGKPVVWLCGRRGENRSLWDAHALVTLVPIHDIVRGFLDVWAAIKKSDPIDVTVDDGAWRS